jgi:hypothetical protein
VCIVDECVSDNDNNHDDDNHDDDDNCRSNNVFIHNGGPCHDCSAGDHCDTEYHRINLVNNAHGGNRAIHCNDDHNGCPIDIYVIVYFHLYVDDRESSGYYNYNSCTYHHLNIGVIRI